MEVLNVPEEKEEEVTLAIEEFLFGKEKVKGINFHYQSRSHSLLVVFQCKEDEKRLQKNLRHIRLDENIFYEVKWTAQNDSPRMPGTLNRNNLVEVLNVTDEDIVADYFKDILGNLPQYLYNNRRQRMVLFLQSDEEKAKVLCDERPVIQDHGPVCVKFIEPSAPGTKFYVEVLNATDEDIVIDYFASLFNRRAVYTYFEESARMVLTLENRAEFETVLTKEVHQIEDLNDEVSVREWIPPVKGLKVTGIPSSVSQKFLNCYFKDAAYGGGAIKTLNWDPPNHTATIFFHQYDVAERVINKGPHTIREIPLSMELIEDNCVEVAVSRPASCIDGKDNISSATASNRTNDCQVQVKSCLVVYSDTTNVAEIKSNIKKSWQLHDGEFELLFNPSERVGIVRVTTTAANLDQAVTKPLKNGVKFEKCDGEINSLLGDVHVLIDQISAETSREAVWSWLMVVTRCAAHTVYYSDVLPSNSMKAVALISFHEGLELETSLAKASDVQYFIDNRTLSPRVIRSPRKLMYVGITKKSKPHIKQELQQLLDLDSNDDGRVEDVEFFGDHAIVTLSSKKAFRKLLMNNSRLGCSYVLPYYDQLGCISSSHIVNYSTLATKIKGDWSTSETGRLVCPRLFVTVLGNKLKEDTLRKFFADRSASGGDKSAILRSNTDGGFVVTFDDPQAADRVYQKYQNEGLRLGASNLSVLIRGMRETPNSSKSLILVRNIGLASEDSIKYFLWALADTSVARLTFVRDPHDGALCAIARFQRAIDRYRLAYYCEIATLDCKLLDVEPVEQPRALALYNVPSNADQQLVKYCFEPDDVADCVEKENGIWIIYFKNPEYAEEALSVDLLYGGTIRLSAELYSEYQVETNAREKGKRGLHQVRCNWASLQIVNFIKEWRQHDFNDLIKDTQAVCEFTEDGHLLICLSGSLTADHVRLVEEKFRSFLNNYTFWQVDVLPDLFNDVLNSKELVEIQRLDKSILHVEAREVDQSKSLCRVILTGQSSAVQSARQKVEQAIRLISEERERQKQRTRHTEVLSPWIAKLLIANDVRKKLQEKYRDTVLAIDESRCTCHLEGFPSDIKVVVDEIKSIVKSSKEATFEVSPQASDFMQRTSVAATLRNKLAQAGLASNVLWFIPQACLVQVQSLDAEAALQAIRIMRNEITDTFVSVGEGMHAFLNTEKWKDCVDAIRGRRNGDVIIVENVGSCQLQVVCWTNDSAQVLEEINNFTRKNVIKTEFLQLPRAVVQLLTTAMLPDIKKMEHGQARHYVRLTSKLVHRGASGFHIEGNIDGVANIKRSLERLVTKQPKLVTTLHSVSDPGAPAFFKDNLLVLQSIGLETKTYVEIFDPNSFDVPCAVDDSDEVVVLPGEVAVEIKKVDITELECDVIVNPSNENLHHAGGLAAAIARAAGQDLVNECQEYVRLHGALPEGQVCITSAGNGKLRCKKVVHAIGPRWQGGNRSEVNRLFQAVQNSLYCVEQYGLASVALPPISSGIFNYPLDKCADTIVESLASYCEQKKGSLSRVFLVDINEEGMRQFRRALYRYLGKDIKPDLKSDVPVQKTKARPQPPTTASDIARKTSPTATFTIGEVLVEIINGDVTSQQVDVIVSTINEDLDLSAGVLSKLIAKEAGKEMQQQLHSQYSSPFNKGDIAVTDGHQLACKKVYHVCCPEFVSSQYSRPVQKVTLKCLKEANDRMLSSIALPAVGTGSLCHPTDAVAEQMYHAAVLFCSSVRSPVLRNVKFVLKDSIIYESFMAYHSSFRHGDLFSKKYPPTTGDAREAAFVYEEAAASAATRNHHNDQSVSSTTLSASRKDLEVNGVNIEVLHGDITDHDSDAIVNCTNSDFSLDSQVAKALCLKGGPTIAEECRKKASIDSIRRSGVFLQKSSSLKCSYIIHVDGELNLKEVMWKCLKRADDEHVTSVAFPAIGTGAKGRNASEVAPQLISALVEFLRDSDCRYLRRVQFVIFNHTLLQSFREALDTVIVPNVPADFLSSRVSRRFEELSGSEDTRALLNSEGLSGIMDVVVSDSVLSICGTEDNIQLAISRIEKCCKTAMKVRDITDAPDIIEELTDEEAKNFLQLGKRLGVAIDVNKRRKLIALRSMDESSLIKVRTAIVKSLYDRRTTALNEKISDRDVRNLQKEAENVCSRVLWQYKAKDSPNWSNYPLALNKKIEEGYAKKLSSISYGFSTFRFTIDLSQNVDSSDSQLDMDVNVRRQDLNLDLPDYWNSNSSYEEVILDPNSSEYVGVKKEFMSTLLATQTKVLQITRIQNPHYYRQYVQQKARVQSGMSPGSTLSVERKLWHGTSEVTLKSICHGGFNRSYCGKNATVYGRGVYFARDASYSWNDTYSVPNTAGEKYIMQCLVLTGEYEVGNSNTVFPSKKPHPSHFSYDTTVNDVNNPILFVTYNDVQAYPAYIIKFHVPRI